MALLLLVLQSSRERNVSRALLNHLQVRTRSSQCWKVLLTLEMNGFRLLLSAQSGASHFRHLASEQREHYREKAPESGGNIHEVKGKVKPLVNHQLNHPCYIMKSHP